MRKRRTIGPAAVALAAATVALAVAAPAAEARLTAQEARHNVRAALADTLENAWNHGEGRWIRCSRQSPRAVTCRLRWFVGDGAYRGRVSATETSRRRSVVGNVVLIDQYCLHVSMAGNCTSSLPVRWHRPLDG